jgi:mRNA-degrading endonuclease YafQ of YafQ-DinJ toxin-antitoxin module
MTVITLTEELVSRPGDETISLLVFIADNKQTKLPYSVDMQLSENTIFSQAPNMSHCQSASSHSLAANWRKYKKCDIFADSIFKHQ